MTSDTGRDGEGLGEKFSLWRGILSWNTVLHRPNTGPHADE